MGDIERICNLFTHVPRHVVEKEFAVTRCAETVINKILDGKIGLDPEDDSDLPDLPLMPIAPKPYKRQQSIEISSSDDDDDDQIPSMSPQKKFKSMSCDAVAERQDVMAVKKMVTASVKNIRPESVGPDTHILHHSEQLSQEKNSKGKRGNKEGQVLLKQMREAEKERKRAEQVEKKQAKEREALLKRAATEARRNATPKECMKFVTVVIDPGLLKFSCGAPLLTSIQETDLRHDIQQQPLPNVVTFFREVTQVKDLGGNKITTETREVLEDQLLLYIPAEDFVNFTQPSPEGGTGLRRYIEQLRLQLEGRDVTLIVQGLEKYFKGAGKPKRGRAKQTAAPRPELNKGDIDMVLMEAQLFTGCNIKLLETDAEVAKAVLQYAKAVAERPHKQERLNTGFSFHVEGNNAVRVTSDGTGLVRVWRQQIQQFKNISAEVANAIMAAYPAPRKLWEAYQACFSEKEAESLLQDIMVRRGYGVMETSRRVGKEMSRRMYQLFTSNDPELALS